MKIGILAADSHNFPNLPLMKISAFYKANGHEVEWWKAEGEYDIVFCSVIFSETEIPEVNNAKRVCIGGSGIDLDNRLPPEIEHTTPDYSIYPQYNFAVGFLTRGLPAAKSRAIARRVLHYTGKGWVHFTESRRSFGILDRAKENQSIRSKLTCL